MSSVSFTYAGASPVTLVRSRSFDCHGYMPLLSVAGNEGSNLKLGGVDGLLTRPTTRGELVVGLSWTLRGQQTIAGAAGTSYFDQLHLNLAALPRWFDAAPGGLVTVTVTVGTATFTGGMQHVSFGDAASWQGRVYQLEQIVRVPDGLLA